MRPAVFVDKDGTLVENVPYNVDPAQIRLAPGARECVSALHKAGFGLFVVSNQPGVALGKFDESRLKNVEMTIQRLLDHSISGFYFCIHHPDGGCGCRKPGPGLLQRAAREHAISLDQSWMVGDILDDIEAGRRAGCRTVLVDAGNETEWQLGQDRVPDCIVRDLGQAARRILLTPMRTS